MRTPIRPAFLALAWIAVVPAAHAQALPGGAVLGMSVPQLRQAAPTVKPVPHPVRLAGGLTGSWADGAVEAAGIALTPTYYFADGELRRVEYLARDGSSASFDALLAWGRDAWGPELPANQPEGTYASWTSETMDVYLQQSRTPRGEVVRLVARRRVTKDGGEL